MYRYEFVENYINASKVAIKNGHLDLAWKSLELAHIISQPSATLHFKVHWVMLVLASKTFDLREIFGQVFRLIVAAPGSFFGKFPRGNTGRSNVSAFQEMATPAELEVILDQLRIK